MFQNIRKFLGHAGGNTAMMMALAAIPLCTAIGAAVDYSRASSAKSVIQAATDAAALAAVKDLNLSKSEIENIVVQYLTANGIDKAVAHVNEVTVEHDKKTGTVSVRVVGSLDTSLMQLAGIQDMDIGGYSEVQAGGNALEVALVLDNTFSMTIGNRIGALKTASHAMIDELFVGTGSGTDTKVSIVPFSEYVNVGEGNRNAPWIDVKADYDDPPRPNNVAVNCRTVASDGVANSNVEQCDWIPDPNGGTWTKQNRWGGCVGSRSDELDTEIDELSTHYTGLLNGEHPNDWWISCPQEVTPLTANKSKLSSNIDAMIPTGETYIPIGLLWGWNLLDSEAPFIEGRSVQQIADDRGTKALVLMTDGDNTIKPQQYPWHFKSDGDANWGDVANAKTAQLCESIKAAGIKIYTVSLMVDSEASRLRLLNCASSPSMAFNADDNAALVSAFKEIAGQLAAIHISR
jgi:Flp pilus assembly protein TadG